MLYSCFVKKAVVNVVDGTKLGHVSDILFDATTGKIHRISVEEYKGIFNLFKKIDPISIKWSQIVKIGEDVIIVNYLCENKNKGD